MLFSSDIVRHPSKWETCFHPEGNTYFKQTWPPIAPSGICLLTEDDLHDKNTEHLINKAVELLYTKINNCRDSLPRNYFDAYIGIIKRDKISADAVYYLVDHKKRSVFWMDDVELTRETILNYHFCNTTIESEEHLRMYQTSWSGSLSHLFSYEEQAIDYYYWISKEICDHLQSVLLYGCCGSKPLQLYMRFLC